MALETAWQERASEEEIAAAGHAVNFDEESVTCPACQTTFSPEGEEDEPIECPDCGLRLG